MPSAMVQRLSQDRQHREGEEALWLVGTGVFLSEPGELGLGFEAGVDLGRREREGRRKTRELKQLARALNASEHLASVLGRL